MKKCVLALTLLALFFLPKITQAESKSWFFSKWDAAYRINEDSTVLVQEAQTFDFTGDFSWVTRILEKNKGIRYEDIKVSEVEGRQLTSKEVEITEDEKYVTIKLNFDLSDTSKTWIFEYKIIGGIGFFDNYDEFYWNVVSPDRPVEIKEIQATVYLPEAVPVDNIKQKIYLGTGGSKEESLDYTAGTEEMNFFGRNILPYENFTIVAGWPKGVVEYPGYLLVHSSEDSEEKTIQADIAIDGEKISARTPTYLLIGYDVQAGARTIEISRFGYETYSEQIEVEKGKDQEILFTLEQEAWYAWGWKAFRFLSVLYFISPVFLFLYLLIKWKNHGRDPKSKGTVIAQYEPPDETGPAVMGTLIDERADLNDISATIIDLAYRGYLKIYEEEKKALFQKQKQYRFERLKDYSSDSDLKEYERELLAGMFGGKNMVKLEDLKYKFQTTLKTVKKSLYKEVTNLGYFESNPETVRNKYLLVGGILLAVGWIFMIVPSFWGLMIVLVGMAMPKKTLKGVEAKWHADGFKIYLYTAERFRLGQVTPETFEKFLSYAMVFKVEDKWADRFKDIYKEPPEWYVGGAGARAFAITSFTSNLSSSFTTTVSHSFSSTPSSSSGFSGGGGFAGGGGGGGGSGAG